MVFDYLMRQGSTPVIENDVIKYVAREMTEEEKHKNSRKQSLMDNPKMLYFYSDNSRYYHDKECDDVKEIIKQLRMIGNNLNQIAVIGYKTGTIDILKYKRNCSELEKNVQLILSNVTEPTRMEK